MADYRGPNGMCSSLHPGRKDTFLDPSIHACSLDDRPWVDLQPWWLGVKTAAAIACERRWRRRHRRRRHRAWIGRGTGMDRPRRGRRAGSGVRRSGWRRRPICCSIRSKDSSLVRAAARFFYRWLTVVGFLSQVFLRTSIEGRTWNGAGSALRSRFFRFVVA